MGLYPRAAGQSLQGLNQPDLRRLGGELEGGLLGGLLLLLLLLLLADSDTDQVQDPVYLDIKQ